MSTNFKQHSSAEIERLINICRNLHCADAQKSFIHQAHATLNHAFENVCFSMAVYSLKPFRLRTRKINTAGFESLSPMFNEHILNHPHVQRFAFIINPNSGMMRLSPSPEGFLYPALCNQFHEQLQASCQLWTGIRDDSELLNCIYSRDKKYTPEQLATTLLIQSHLATAWQNWKRNRALRLELDSLKAALFPLMNDETDLAQIIAAIKLLTPRQFQVAEQVLLGKDNQQIADELKISVQTVKNHLHVIFHKLSVQHRTELTAKWHHVQSATEIDT